MKFKKALKAMKEGKTLSRKYWSNYTAKLQTPSCRTDISIGSKCIMWSGGVDGDFWFTDVNDYDADDWYIVEDDSDEKHGWDWAVEQMKQGKLVTALEWKDHPGFFCFMTNDGKIYEQNGFNVKSEADIDEWKIWEYES